MCAPTSLVDDVGLASSESDHDSKSKEEDPRFRRAGLIANELQAPEAKEEDELDNENHPPCVVPRLMHWGGGVTTDVPANDIREIATELEVLTVLCEHRLFACLDLVKESKQGRSIDRSLNRSTRSTTDRVADGGEDRHEECDNAHDYRPNCTCVHGAEGYLRSWTGTSQQTSCPLTVAKPVIVPMASVPREESGNLTTTTVLASSMWVAS